MKLPGHGNKIAILAHRKGDSVSFTSAAHLAVLHQRVANGHSRNRLTSLNMILLLRGRRRSLTTFRLHTQEARSHNYALYQQNYALHCVFQILGIVRTYNSLTSIAKHYSITKRKITKSIDPITLMYTIMIKVTLQNKGQVRNDLCVYEMALCVMSHIRRNVIDHELRSKLLAHHLGALPKATNYTMLQYGLLCPSASWHPLLHHRTLLVTR